MQNIRFRSFLHSSLFAACLGHIIWGFGALFTKIALRGAAPEVMLSLRFLIAAFFMTMMILLGKERVSFRGKNFKPLLLMASTELLCFYCETYGILYTNATFSGVALSITPVVAIILAAIFLKELPKKRQTIFSIVSVLGVIVMTVSGNSIGIIRPVGIAFLLGSCFCSAAYKTANRRSAEEFTPFERTYFVIMACAVVFTLSAVRSTNGSLRAYIQPLADPAFLFPVIILGVFSSVAANLLINKAAGKMPVVKLASLGSLTTLCSAFSGIFFLHEPISAGLLVGAALILIGIHQVTKE